MYIYGLLYPVYPQHLSLVYECIVLYLHGRTYLYECGLINDFFFLNNDNIISIDRALNWLFINLKNIKMYGVLSYLDSNERSIPFHTKTCTLYP